MASWEYTFTHEQMQGLRAQMNIDEYRCSFLQISLLTLPWLVRATQEWVFQPALGALSSVSFDRVVRLEQLTVIAVIFDKSF